MNIKKPHLIIAAVVGGIFILGLIAFFTFRQGNTASNESNVTATQGHAPAAPQKDIPQAQVTTQQLMQNGLYTIDYKNFASASLTNRYDFIAGMLKPMEDPNSPGDILPPPMPENIRLAEISIPQKKLSLLAIYTEGMDFCVGKYCQFSLYVKRPNGFENYIGLPSTQQSYIMVDDKSVSVIVCSEYEPYYQQWRLEDGALEKPIPPNSPGHFVPVGAFKHDKIAACP